jgi:hypothetical protein
MVISAVERHVGHIGCYPHLNTFLPSTKTKPQLPLMWSMVYDLNVVSVHGVSFTVLN